MLERGEFFFDPSWELFGMHFPGRPVVPGSLIIGCFLKRIEESFGLGDRSIRIKRFRFLDFVSPGRYPYDMEERDTTIFCRLWGGDKILCDGIIEITR